MGTLVGTSKPSGSIGAPTGSGDGRDVGLGVVIVSIGMETGVGCSFDDIIYIESVGVETRKVDYVTCKPEALLCTSNTRTLSVGDGVSSSPIITMRGSPGLHGSWAHRVKARCKSDGSISMGVVVCQ